MNEEATKDRPSRRASRGHLAVALLAAAGVLGGAGIAVDAGGAAAANRDAGIRAVRAHTERYQDEAAAVADGFVRTDVCVEGMGYHYVNYGRFDAEVEPSRPEVLIYAEDPAGTRRLVAAEWVVVDGDQDLTTDDDRPSVYGHAFDGPMDGHEPGMPRHYDLHAWAWEENEAGAFEAFNPAITCGASE